MDDNTNLPDVIAGIADATVISILLPFLRRSLVIDTRRGDEYDAMVRVLPQVNTVEERMRSIETLRPGLGRVRSILAIPWMRTMRDLRATGIPGELVDRLVATGTDRVDAQRAVDDALRQLLRYERMAFARMVTGQGFGTIWTRSR
jgi:hypothetical protein